MAKGTPPGDAVPPPRQRATPARKLGCTLWGRCSVPTPTPTAPGTHGSRYPGCPPLGTAAGGGTAPDTRRPSQRWQATPPGDGPPTTPAARSPQRACNPRGQCWAPTPARRRPQHMGSGPHLPAQRAGPGGGGAPDLRRPSQRREAPPPGTPFRHPRSAQRRPARAHAVGPVLGPHARTNRTQDTRVAEPRLPAPEDEHLGEGQRLTPDAPHNGGRPPPPGTAPHHPRGTQPPQGAQAKGTVLGPHTRTPAPTTRGYRTPTARPEGGQLGEGERLTSDAPHNGERHPPPGDALPPPPQRATPARKGARCGDGAGSPRPHQPHPGHIGRGTPTARPWGRRPVEGQRLTPDAPHNGGRPPPPGTPPPPPPRHAAPRGHASREDSAGPPHPHAGAHSTWVADPICPPRGHAARGGGAPDLRRPSQRRKAPPRGRPSATPAARNAGPQGRTLWGRCWVPTPAPTAPRTHGSAARPRGRAPVGGTAPDTRRPSQRWQATPPGDGPPPPPRHAAPTGHASQGDSAGPPHPHTRAHSTWVADPDRPPRGRAAGEGGAPDLRRPSQRRKAPPPGDALPPPPQRATPARKGARCGAGARSPTPTPTAPGTHGSRNPGCLPQRTGKGGAPDLRRPSQRRKAPPPGTLFHHPHSAQRRPARAHAVGPVLGPHARTNRTQDTRVAVPWLPAPEDGHLGEG